MADKTDEKKRSQKSVPEPASDSGCSRAASPSDGEMTDPLRHVLLDGSRLCVDRGIDARVLALVWPEAQEDADDDDDDVLSFPTQGGRSEGQFVAGLNAALLQGELLWALFETAVVGLGAGVVVKTSTPLDGDGIANLDYVRRHVPAVPAPDLLGAVTWGPLADWPEYFPTEAMGAWPVEYALDSLIGRWLG